MYLLLLIVPAILGSVVSLFPYENKTIKTTIAILCAISCITGITSFFINDYLSSITYILGLQSLLGTYNVKFDQLSSLTLTLSSVVYLMILMHMWRSEKTYGKRMFGLASILFVACSMAMYADSVILLLISWELITLTTFMMTKGADESFRWKYLVITHFGGLLIMSVFVYMWYISGTAVLSEMDIGPIVGSLTSALMILLLFIGFGTKLGLMPFHAWMPDLYNSSSIHSVSFLSTICSNVAILILIKSSFLWIGVPENLVLMFIILLLASISAIWGAMESLIQTEPRRILAYSSMENMSMVILCLAMGMIFAVTDFDVTLLPLILVAAILHTINHSFFKSLMLLNVGTIEESTGEHSISRMGGLAKYMPLLSMFALIGTLAMAAIPPLNGFVSEWLMIKTVVTAGTGGSMLNIVLPLVIVVLGICGTMAAVSYARLYGFIFLGRPRSKSMENAKKMDKMTAFPLLILSGACIALGIFAMPLIYAIIDSMCSTLGITYTVGDVVSNALKPIMIALILASICLIVYILFRTFNKKKAETSTWDCGTELNENMQYSSEGFTQPLVKVFHPIYGDESEIKDVTGGTDTFKISFMEPFSYYILRPIGRSVEWLSLKVGKIQTGNIQSYLAYMMITLIVVLLGVRLF
jgi:hydrogenase-4 component B